MKKLLTLVFILSASGFAYAQTWQDTVAQVQQIFSRYKPENPGCQLAISRNGKVLFSSAWGSADLEHGVPLTTGSVIEAGSVSKQFAAAAILLLQQQGKLSLEDDVRKYVPELPDYGTPIKLRHLLNHTSGLRDWGSVMEMAGWPRTTKTYSNADALAIIARQKALNHKPGSEYIYSNSNYNLFAIIVERVSGKSLAAYTHEYIFEPAGMTKTQWRDDFKRIVPNRAIAYAKAGNGYETDMPNEYVYGNGGLLTTTEDLLKWNDYYVGGKFGKPPLLPELLKVVPLNNGAENNYGAGLFIGKSRGWDNINHSGATASYRAYLEYYPQLKLSIAWLSNTSEFDSKRFDVLREVEKLFVKDIAPGAAKAETKVVPVTDLNGLTGWYRNPRTGAGIQLQATENKLMLDNSALTAMGANTFTNENIELQFLKQKGLLYIIPHKDTIRYTAVEPAKLVDKAKAAYVGKYFSEEAEAFVHVTLTNGDLVLHQTPTTKVILKSTYKDGFALTNGTTLYFERDKKNRIRSFKITNARARNVEFVKAGKKKVSI